MLFSADSSYRKKYFRRALICVPLLLMLASSCGDPLFLSYQIRKSDSRDQISDNSKTAGGVTVSAVSDDYTLMQAEYSAFLVSIVNGSKTAITIELNRIELKYTGQSSRRIKPKKKYESFALEPGERCDVRISYSLPFEAGNVRGLTWTNTLSVPVVFFPNGKSEKTEYFTFTSVQRSREPLSK